MANIVIPKPGGAIEQIELTKLLWMRTAFANEVPNTIRLAIGHSAAYSAESMPELKIQTNPAFNIHLWCGAERPP
jgi:hypothetical protein